MALLSAEILTAEEGPPPVALLAVERVTAVGQTPEVAMALAPAMLLSAQDTGSGGGAAYSSISTMVGGAGLLTSLPFSVGSGSPSLGSGPRLSSNATAAAGYNKALGDNKQASVGGVVQASLGDGEPASPGDGEQASPGDGTLAFPDVAGSATLGSAGSAALGGAGSAALGVQAWQP
ncbi:UNVERIFIED_CONTAM: hypothetical protein FKN15_053281 [Acipenser sinensis]